MVGNLRQALNDGSLKSRMCDDLENMDEAFFILLVGLSSQYLKKHPWRRLKRGPPGDATPGEWAYLFVQDLQEQIYSWVWKNN